MENCALYVEIDQDQDEGNYHLSSTANNKQLLVTSKAGGSRRLELKLADWNAKGPVFCKIPSQSSLNIQSAPDLKCEVPYDCL